MNPQDDKDLAFAEQYFHAGRADLAEVILNKLLVKYPEQAKALEILGYIAGNRGDLVSATDLLTRAHQAQADNPSVAYYLAYCLQQAGRHDQAIAYFKQSLAKQPFAEGLRNYAYSLHAIGQKIDGLTCLAQALALEPQTLGILYDYASALTESELHKEALEIINKLLHLQKNSSALLLRARILQKIGEQAQAVSDTRAALRMDPNNAVAWIDFAALLFEQNEFEASAEASERALSIDSTRSLAWLNYAAALLKIKRTKDCVAACEKVIELDPENAQAWLNKAMAHGELSETEAAIEAYQKAKCFGATASQIDYALAAYGAVPMPTESPQDYVKTLFDNYADRFDEHLLKGLEYQVPTVMDRMISQLCDSKYKGTVFDLGCGTGLFGSSLKLYADKLIGLDLSPKMLDVAQQKGIYTELHACDVLEYLKETQQSIRMAVALDVFVYIGDLESIFAELARLSLPNAEFAFSIEENFDDTPYQLLPSLRYAHSESYIFELQEKYGFGLIAKEALVSRKDRGQPVYGKIFILRKR
jgi:predicted TPR repeat methyltransferase